MLKPAEQKKNRRRTKETMVKEVMESLNKLDKEGKEQIYKLIYFLSSASQEEKETFYNATGFNDDKAPIEEVYRKVDNFLSEAAALKESVALC